MSGFGISKITVDNAITIDSNQQPIPVSFTADGYTNQGAPTDNSNAWPVKITDGTNVMPTGDEMARPIYVTLTDGFDTPTIGLDGSIKVDASQYTQPISASSLPLPSGAATDASLTNGSQKTKIIGETSDGIQTEVKVSATQELSVEIGGANISAFGDLITAPNFPIMQFDFVQTLVTAGTMNQIGGAYVTNSGTAETNNGRLLLQSGTNAAGSSVFISNKTARYRAGQGITARFTALWASSAANSIQIVGMCCPTITWTNNATAPGQPITAITVGDGFFFGFNGTSFGIRHKNSRANADTWYPQSEWNVDRCDGSGTRNNQSGFNWDKTKGNVMMIRYPYLGYGYIKFYVQNPDTTGWILTHIINYANSSAEVQVSNPSFNFFAQTINSGNTSNLSMYVGSVGVLLSGDRTFLGPQFGVDARLTSIGQTELPVLSLRCATSLNGSPNRGMIRLRSMSISADNANTDCRVRIRRNSTLTNSTFANAIYGTITTNSVGYILTSAQSMTTFDTAATAISAVSAGASDVIFNTVCARNTGYQIDLTPFEIYVIPGDTITITAVSGAANNVVQVALNWNEDI